MPHNHTGGFSVIYCEQTTLKYEVARGFNMP
jgi:hypothetical protein